MNLPAEFTERIKKEFKEESDAFLDALFSVPPVSIRKNPRKSYCENKIIDEIKDTSVPWSDSGFYLKERPFFTGDPLFHAGCYYVQEASSMFVGQALKAIYSHIDEHTNDNLRALDLCAAPGGKSTLLLSALPETGVLVTNEIIRSRANILSENIMKWGYSNVIVSSSDPLSFSSLPDTFDIMLADVPCSGEGMFRKDPAAVREWSPGNVYKCVQRQRKILNDSWAALKEGGFLIYSTCTYNIHENEENIKWICDNLGAETIEIPVDKNWNIFLSDYDGLKAYRFFPHKTKGEGFFLCLMRKSSSGMISPIVKRRRGNKSSVIIGQMGKKSFLSVKDYVMKSDDFYFFTDVSGRQRAIKTRFTDFADRIISSLKILNCGIQLGEMKGKDFVPDIALSLSDDLNKDYVATYNLSNAQALKYLRGESMILPDDCPRGYVVVLYNDVPLGWIKNLGNRVNNNYPKEWRIKKEL